MDLWREGRPFDAAACLQQLENLSFLDERACAAVRGKEETDPYLVRGLQWNKDCGLYCILAFDDDRVRSLVEGLLQSLSFSGVGGETERWLRKIPIGVLRRIGSKRLRSGPGSGDIPVRRTRRPLDDPEYLAPGRGRAGGSDGTRGIFPLQKRGLRPWRGLQKADGLCVRVRFCFSKRFTGQVRNVAPEGRQPALRMLKPMFLGVDV